MATKVAASLRAAADWNAEKGLALYRQSAYVKNHDRLQHMIKDYKRHIHNADQLRRSAWLEERRR